MNKNENYLIIFIYEQNDTLCKMLNKELLLQNSGLTRLELIVKISPLYPGDIQDLK